jgi:hypothetical protein
VGQSFYSQAGPDHTDSHRAPFYAISAYNRSGTVHRFINRRT